MDKKALGKRLNAVRKDGGYTAEKLSEICDINATFLRHIEGGSKLPSLPVFVDLCNALKVSPDYLLRDDLGANELTGIRELESLWSRATPSRQALVIAMLRAALDVPEEE